MAGRRLIDAWKLFNASKGVAQQHIKLRSQQLDVFSRTSSLAKAAKSQTDRITLTLEAARVLSQRLNEEVPKYAQQATRSAPSSHNTDIPRTETVTGQPPRKGTTSGLEQDHHYDRSARNTKAEPLTEGELGVKQEDAERAPLPDGTIPSSGVTLEREEKGQDTFSERPVPEPPKEPLAEEHQAEPKNGEGIRPVESGASTIPLPGKPTGASSNRIMSVEQMRAQHEDSDQIPSHANEPYHPTPAPQAQKLQEGHDRDVFYARSVESKPTSSSSPQTQIPTHAETEQESDPHVRDEHMNQDVFYSRPEPAQARIKNGQNAQRAAVPEQNDMPEGINTDVFRTKRVAKMLGGNPYQQKSRHDLEGDARTPRHQDTPTVRESEQSQPFQSEASVAHTQSGVTADEMRDLASQLADDPEVAKAQVCTGPWYIVSKYIHSLTVSS